MIDATIRSLLSRSREKLSESIHNVRNGRSPAGQYVVINDLAQVISDRTGSWTDDLAEAKAVPEGFDPKILGGRLVVDRDVARRMLLERLEYEQRRIEGMLFEVTTTTAMTATKATTMNKEQNDG